MRAQISNLFMIAEANPLETNIISRTIRVRDLKLLNTRIYLVEAGVCPTDMRSALFTVPPLFTWNMSPFPN